MSRSCTSWSGSCPRNMRFRLSEIIVRPPFCFADEHGFGAGVLRRPPGQRERLHDGEPLHGIDRESAGANDIANHIDETRAAYLNCVAGTEFGIVIGCCIRAAGIQHHRMRRFGIAADETR